MILPHLLTNFEIQKYQNEPKFCGVSRNNLLKIKVVAYTINPDECKSIETHLIALHVNGDDIAYFDSFGVEHISKEIKKIKGNRNIVTNICRIQAYNWISPSEYEKNDEVILKYFK